MPSERSWTWSTSRALGGAPRMASSCCADVRAPEALQLDALHRPYALPAGDERPQRMAAVQLVGAEADDHEHASGVQRAHEQGHEVERRPIRPVQILDHEHERAVGGEPLDHAHDQLEQARRAALAERSALLSALSGSRSGSTCASSERAGPDEGIELLGRRVAHERAERVRERAERQALAAHLDAAAREDPRARRARALGRLLDEPRLAHAGLAAQEHHRRIAPRPQRRAPPSASASSASRPTKTGLTRVRPTRHMFPAREEVARRGVS